MTSLLSKHRHAAKTHSTRSERTLYLRLMVAWMLSITLLGLMRSRMADALFEHPLIEPTTPTIWVYMLPFLFFALFGIAMRRDVRSRSSLPRPLLMHGILALVSTVLLSLLSLSLLHPSATQFEALQQFGTNHPPIGDPLLGALLSFLLFLPILPILWLVLPMQLLQRHHMESMLITLAILGFLLFPALEAAYFHITAPPLIAAVQWVLRQLPGTIPTDMSQWQVGYESFTATVGYACTELSSVVFLIGLLGIAFHSLHRRHPISLHRASAILLLGFVLLWVLNVLRIAAIVVIGSYHRAFALSLFHSGIGLILFLLFFLFFTKLSLPFVRQQRTP